jgi:hypothetical protein
LCPIPHTAAVNSFRVLGGCLWSNGRSIHSFRPSQRTGNHYRTKAEETCDTRAKKVRRVERYGWKRRIAPGGAVRTAVGSLKRLPLCRSVSRLTNCCGICRTYATTSSSLTTVVLRLRSPASAFFFCVPPGRATNRGLIRSRDNCRNPSLLNCSTDGLSLWPLLQKAIRPDIQTSKYEEWSGRADLNCRPLAPQASALPG